MTGGRHLWIVPSSQECWPEYPEVLPEHAAPVAAQLVLDAAREWFSVALEWGELDGLSMTTANQLRVAVRNLADAVSSYEHHRDRLSKRGGPAISGS